MIGFQAKIIGMLAIVLIGAGVYVKHLIYESGVKDATLQTVAEAAERTVESERRTSKSLTASEKAQAEGSIEVAALRERAEKNAREAAAARADAEKHARRAAAMETKAGEIAPCPPPAKPAFCPADVPVRQP